MLYSLKTPLYICLYFCIYTGPSADTYITFFIVLIFGALQTPLPVCFYNFRYRRPPICVYITFPKHYHLHLSILGSLQIPSLHACIVHSNVAPLYRSADDSLARPTSRCILFDG